MSRPTSDFDGFQIKHESFLFPSLVQEQTKNAQFIIISLRNNMFEIADRLIGIYKTHNTTKSVGINPKTIMFREHDAITA